MMEIHWHPNNRQVRIFALASLRSGAGGRRVLDARFPAGDCLWCSDRRAVFRGRRRLAAGTAAAAGGNKRGDGPLTLLIHDLVLSLAFFVVVAPVGMLMRCFGRDALQLKIDRDLDTYWQPKKQPRNVRSYYRRW